MVIIILKGWFNLTISSQKGAFDDMINKYDYLRGRNIFQEINQKLKVSKYVTG